MIIGGRNVVVVYISCQQQLELQFAPNRLCALLRSRLDFGHSPSGRPHGRDQGIPWGLSDEFRAGAFDPGCVKRALILVPLGQRTTFVVNRQRSRLLFPLESRANRNVDRAYHRHS